jgi:hypothetical protein
MHRIAFTGGHMKLPSCRIVAVGFLLSAASLPLFAAVPRIDLLGDPAPVSAAAYTIVITPDTKWLNVTGGDVVKFVAGDKSFAWAFNVAFGVSSFDLNRVAPPGILGRTVRVYVAPDPRYIGGGDGDRNM